MTVVMISLSLLPKARFVYLLGYCGVAFLLFNILATIYSESKNIKAITRPSRRADYLVKETPKEGSQFYTRKTFNKTPSSSVWCSGDRENRICNFKYLYYIPKRDRFVFLKDDRSTIFNANQTDEGFLDLTSLSGHNAFYWEYVESSASVIASYKTVNYVPKKTFMFSRFHVGNIMHTIHDDVLGLYFVMKMHSSNHNNKRDFEDIRTGHFDKDVNIVLYDGWKEGDYGHLFKYFTDNKLVFKDEIKNDHLEDAVFCFSDIVVGNSKQANWYQYGFGIPQGPIANKTVNGQHVREVADFILAENNLPTWESTESVFTKLQKMIKVKGAPPSSEPVSADHYISIFSRKGDRLMLNEQDLAKSLTERYKLPTRFVRMEDQTFKQQVEILRKTVIAVGMHGSLLIMGMFLPENAVMIELFPYGVPANNYTPYKTMARLNGINIRYKSWTNSHTKNNVPHPDRPGHIGGINHLPEKERSEILNSTTVPEHFCCSNPFWLFRIYQDTKIEIKEILKLIDAEIKSPLIKNEPIEDEVCINGKQGEHSALELKWSKPWNGVDPIKYGIWVHQDYRELYSDTESLVFLCKPETEYDFWVRSYYSENGKVSAGEYGKKFTCKCH